MAFTRRTQTPRHLWPVVLLATLVSGGVAVMASHLAPAVFQAERRVDIAAARMDFGQFRALVQSLQTGQRVVTACRLDIPPASLTPRRFITSHVSATFEPRTGTAMLCVRLRDPALAARAADSLASVSVQRVVEYVGRTADDLQRQLQENQVQLQQAGTEDERRALIKNGDMLLARLTAERVKVVQSVQRLSASGMGQPAGIVPIATRKSLISGCLAGFLLSLFAVAWWSARVRGGGGLKGSAALESPGRREVED